MAETTAPQRTRLRVISTPMARICLLRSDRGDEFRRTTCPDGQFWLLLRGECGVRDERPPRTLSAFDCVYSAPKEPCLRTVESEMVAFGVQVYHAALTEWPEGRTWLGPIDSLPWSVKRSFLQVMHGLPIDELEDRLLSLLHASDAARHETERRPAWLSTARQMLHDAPPEQCGLYAIAKSVSLSPAYVSSSFRSAYGVTVGTYRRRRQLERTLEMVAVRGSSLADAAIEAGFYDASHFHRACMAELGLKPTALRAALEVKNRKLVQDLA